MTAILTALQRIAVNPPVALVALPQPPVDSVRSALLLRDTVPAVEATGRMLRDDFRALAEISESLAAARTRVKKQGQKLRKERDALMSHPAVVAGAAYPTNPSSVVAARALDVQPDQEVLDLAAAPGSALSGVVRNRGSSSLRMKSFNLVHPMMSSNVWLGFLNSTTSSPSCAWMNSSTLLTTWLGVSFSPE